MRATFVYGTRAHVPDAMVMTDGTVYRLITDHLGSVRLVVKAETGEVVQRMDYDARSAGPMCLLLLVSSGDVLSPEAIVLDHLEVSLDPDLARQPQSALRRVRWKRQSPTLASGLWRERSMDLDRTGPAGSESTAVEERRACVVGRLAGAQQHIAEALSFATRDFPLSETH